MSVKLNFAVSDEFSIGIERLKGVLDFEVGGDITVTAKKGERLGASLKNGEACIYYKENHNFWRELSVLIENMKKQKMVIYLLQLLIIQIIQI